jgi:hypothetical protein
MKITINDMTLETQVVSLELAKKLKDLGVEQNSVFYWVLGLAPKFHLGMTRLWPFSPQPDSRKEDNN